MSAWRIEAERLRREASSPWTWRNEMLRFQTIQLSVIIAIYLVFGGWATFSFWLAALIGGIYLVSTEAAPLAEIPNLPGMSTQMTNFKNSAQKAAQEQANRARKMFGYS